MRESWIPQKASQTFDSLFFRKVCRLYKGGTMSGVNYLSLSLLFLLLLMYSTTTAAEYTVPRAAYSVYAEDLDLDGDKDIVVGHKYCSQTDWGGISILDNNGYGEFDLVDSLFFTNGFAYVNGNYIDNNNYIDVLSQYVSDDPAPTNNRFIGIVYNYGYQHFNNIIYYSLNTRETIHYITTGDIDGDNDIDIIVSSNNGFFWGYLLNNGNGEYSLPVYYNLNFPPGCITSKDLNRDGRDDIVVGGGQLLIYYSYQTGLDSTSVSINAYLTDLEISDIDNDGNNDIIGIDWGIPGTTKRLLIYSNNENNYFQLVYTKWIDEAMADMFVSDINNDTYPDVLYNVSYSYPNSEYEKTHTYILYNNGDNTFADPIDYQTYLGSCEYTTSIKSFCVDVDDNGLRDIITVNYSYNGDNSINILFQDETGNFVQEPQVCVDEENHIFYNISNYPNPFNPITTINYFLPRRTIISIKIFDITGKFVKTLINEEMNQGHYAVNWNAENMASGVYLYKIEAGDYSDVKKMLLFK